MTPDDLDALATRMETAIEAQRVKLQWFLFFLPLIWAVIGGVLWALARRA